METLNKEWNVKKKKSQFEKIWVKIKLRKLEKDPRIKHNGHVASNTRKYARLTAFSYFIDEETEAYNIYMVSQTSESK